MKKTNSGFIKVPNIWFDVSDTLPFASTLGAKRFTLWFHLQRKSVRLNMSQTIQCQISTLSDELSFMKGFSKPSNVRRYLIELQEFGLIECDSLSQTTKPSRLIEVTLIKQDESKGFSKISTQLYDDKIDKVGYNGLIIFCMIFKYHNVNLGNQDSSNYGHADLTREFISFVTGIKDFKTIHDTITILISSKQLIKLSTQQRYESNDNKLLWMPNRYKALPKYDDSNKYYDG